jgi:hypothetical protein
MPSDINRLSVPTLVRGLNVVAKPCNPKWRFLFKGIDTLGAVPRHGAHAFKTLYQWPLKLR